MTNSTTRQLTKARQLAGPGIAGMDRDTPVYHFDIEKRDVETLLVEPMKFLKRLGLGPEQGIAPNGTMNVHLGNLIWTDNGWSSIGDAAATTKWCCYVVGDSTTCHQH